MCYWEIEVQYFFYACVIVYIKYICICSRSTHPTLILFVSPKKKRNTIKLATKDDTDASRRHKEVPAVGTYFLSRNYIGRNVSSYHKYIYIQPKLRKLRVLKYYDLLPFSTSIWRGNNRLQITHPSCNSVYIDVVSIGQRKCILKRENLMYIQLVSYKHRIYVLSLTTVNPTVSWIILQKSRTWGDSILHWR